MDGMKIAGKTGDNGDGMGGILDNKWYNLISKMSGEILRYNSFAFRTI